jgi:hypothetical protein
MKKLITFFVLAFAFSFVNAQDLMRNGGFENANHFEFWNSDVTVTGASVEPVNIEHHSGTWSVEINSGTSPVGGWTQMTQILLPPSNNIDYKLTVWIKDSVTTSNFLGVYGLTGTDEIALGIDTLNNSTIIDPDSGRIIVVQNFFQNWARINYYFNSGQDYIGYILKFEEATDGNSLTLHLDDFTILPVPGQATIQVTSPNGGEDWSVNSQQNITWTSTNVTNVKIDYSTNNGGVWLNVESSLPAASGNYLWTIPNTPSTQCLIRISDAGLASRFDVSDNVFTIVPLVTVTSPNGGENWLANSQHNITWTSQIITDVSIEYSTNNGSTWVSIISSTPASGGSYNWTVPNTPSTQCLVRLSDANNPSTNDVSDNVFTIAPLITVNAPNGGESWIGNSQHSVNWTSQTITNVSIEYSTNNGSAWISVISSTPASGGSYSWTVPNTPSTQCLVRISDASNASINDVSNATFTISAAPIHVVTLTAPNGGENWVVATNHSITWTRENVSLVKIEYSTDNGSTWIVVVASVPAVAGSYNWTIPNTPSTQCLVRISETINPSVNDVSDNTFTIEEAVSVGDLHSGIPKDYELFQNYPNPFNPSTKIEFAIPSPGQVTIEIFNQLGEQVATILNSYLSVGYYEIEFDARNLPSGLYFYRIFSNKFVSVKKMILLK